jgi:uncharacterized protein
MLGMNWKTATDKVLAAMKVDVKDILGNLGAKKRFSYVRPVELREIGQKPEVSVDVELTNARSRIMVQGNLDADVELTCSRCAEVFRKKLKVDIYEEFLPEGSEELNEDKDLSLTDLNVFTYTDDEIDLEEIVRQNILSALPMQPICSDDCRGLCGNCGQNLNTGACNCKVEQIDRRLMPLQKFKKDE